MVREAHRRETQVGSETDDAATTTNQIGDPSEWVDKYGDYLFNLAISRVRSREVAEDVVQDTFLAAVRARDSFEGRSSVKTWLATILKNKAIDYLRKRSREEKYLVDSEEPEDLRAHFNSFGIWNSFLSNWARDPEKAMEDQQLFKVLESCVNKLPEKSKQVFLMKTFDQVDSEEICNILDISSSNLWVMLHRARMRLRDCIETNWVNLK